MSAEEIWKDIEGTEGNYRISNKGDVFSVRRGIILRYAVSVWGYRQVAFRRNGRFYTQSVHRIVAQAFIPNPQNKPYVNHINCIKTDNRAVNLEWCTRQENMDHAVKNGLLKDIHKTYLDGHHFNKPILQLDMEGNVLNEYDSAKEACVLHGFEKTSISSCCHGRIKSHRGYKWKFKTT